MTSCTSAFPSSAMSLAVLTRSLIACASSEVSFDFLTSFSSNLSIERRETTKAWLSLSIVFRAHVYLMRRPCRTHESHAFLQGSRIRVEEDHVYFSVLERERERHKSVSLSQLRRTTTTQPSALAAGTYFCRHIRDSEAHLAAADDTDALDAMAAYLARGGERARPCSSAGHSCSSLDAGTEASQGNQVRSGQVIAAGRAELGGAGRPEQPACRTLRPEMSISMFSSVALCRQEVQVS